MTQTNLPGLGNRNILGRAKLPWFNAPPQTSRLKHPRGPVNPFVAPKSGQGADAVFSNGMPRSSGPGIPLTGANPDPQQASPLDAEYFNTRNQGQFQAGQQINALNAQGANEKAALGERLRQMTERQPVLRQGATNSANSRGLLYSGALGSQIGDLEKQYLQNQSSANGLFAQHEASRQAQIGGIQGQQGFDDLAAQLAAIQRGQTLAATAPPSASGASTGGPASPPRVVKIAPGRPRSPAAPAKPSLALRAPTRQGLGLRIFNAGKAQHG